MVGDRVTVSPPVLAGDPPVVTQVLPRRGALTRLRGDSTRRSRDGASEHVLAANIDLAVPTGALLRGAGRTIPVQWGTTGAGGGGGGGGA